MCGITGIFNLNGEPVSPVLLRKMTNSIAHRGPDGEGFYTDGFIGLGHRRLAIIDLSPAGHQPMMTPDGLYILSYNGEIYNFQELRAELETLGYHFRSRTDSEVLLYAYAAWGEKVLNRLNGLFAFAIWDRNRQELFLARDRYGIKPLYYTQDGNVFLFGSEIKALLAHPSCKAEPDLEALLEYFTFQNIFTDHTLFTGIRLLPAGSFLRVTLGTTHINQPCRYWDYHFIEPNQHKDINEYAEELDHLLRQSVNRQLVSDVDVGSYLSGGMDSGTITSLAATQLPYLKTFTCGFDLHSASGIELGYDERQKAEDMSYLFKTEHYEMVLKAGDMERILAKLIWHLEDLRVGQCYPNFYVASLASKFVKVVLSGGGGDELFGGYPWRYYRVVGSNNFEDYIDKYYAYWQRLIPNKMIQQVFKPIWSEVDHVCTRDIFRGVFTNNTQTPGSTEDYINHSMYFEAKTFLHGLLLVEDKLSMAHSLETRVPFLDNDLVDFAMRLPVKLKLANIGEIYKVDENEPANKRDKYFQKTKDGKLLLRQVMGKYVPIEIIEAEKQGFSAPDASWFKGESIDFVRREILKKQAHIYNYLDYDAITNLVTEHIEGHQNRRLLIWSLLCFEQWLRTFIP